ncbi:MAG: DUF488 domain-containing protein [Actinomycetota bacterium]
MVFTIGHSTRPVEELVEMLRAHGVTLLVDIRRFPGSRRHPQFNSAALARALSDAGIGYEHAEALGGRRAPVPGSPNTGLRNAQFRGYADHMATQEFSTALDRLIERSEGTDLAVMCAEAVPWRCHRSLLSDALVARGIEVRHIMGVGEAPVHRPSEGARFEGTVVRYPGAEQPHLPFGS